MEIQQKLLSVFTPLLHRDKGPDEKGKHKKKTKEKKTTKLKSKEGIDDGGGWTEVKGSSLSASVSGQEYRCVPTMCFNLVNHPAEDLVARLAVTS